IKIAKTIHFRSEVSSSWRDLSQEPLTGLSADFEAAESGDESPWRSLSSFELGSLAASLPRSLAAFLSLPESVESLAPFFSDPLAPEPWPLAGPLPSPSRP